MFQRYYFLQKKTLILWYENFYSLKMLRNILWIQCTCTKYEKKRIEKSKKKNYKKNILLTLFYKQVYKQKYMHWQVDYKYYCKVVFFMFKSKKDFCHYRLLDDNFLGSQDIYFRELKSIIMIPLWFLSPSFFYFMKF